MAKRRGNQEGSIYKRKDGRWCAQISLNGKRLTHYADTRKECQDWIQATNKQIDQGLSFSGAQMTLEEFLEKWLGAVNINLRPITFDQYSRVVRIHINPVIGHVKLKDLRPDQIQDLYTSRIEEGFKPYTVHKIHFVLHRALNQAVRWGLIVRNPADAVTKPKVDRQEMKTLSDVQVRDLLLAEKGNRYEALFYLAITTGLRRGELLGLRWSDLDWSKRHIHIQRQLQRVPNKGLSFSEPKSSSGRRIIALGTAAVEKLREHYLLQQKERQDTGDEWVENDLIFPSKLGTPMEPRNLGRHFSLLLKRLGFPHIRFHDLRHTAATLMLQQGVHPKVVQERLGHAQINITLDTYSHVLPTMQEEAANRMDELLTPIAVELQ